MVKARRGPTPPVTISTPPYPEWGNGAPGLTLRAKLKSPQAHPKQSVARTTCCPGGEAKRNHKSPARMILVVVAAAAVSEIAAADTKL